MPVPMVCIRRVCMPVLQGRMAVPVRVRFLVCVTDPMLMVMMNVMAVSMIVRHRIMRMPVLVALGQVKPDA
jgi:hypothetical protein